MGGGGSERVCICFPFCKAYNLDCGHVQFLGQGGESRAGCVHTGSISGCTGVQIAIWSMITSLSAPLSWIHHRAAIETELFGKQTASKLKSFVSAPAPPCTAPTLFYRHKFLNNVTQVTSVHWVNLLPNALYSHLNTAFPFHSSCCSFLIEHFFLVYLVFKIHI